MKRIIQLCCLVLIVLLSSCATKQVSLDKTVWFNASPSENNGQKGSVVTSLYFVSPGQVDIYTYVMVDTTIIVKPFLYGKGKYITEPYEKVNKINVQVNSIDNKDLSFNGYYDNETLFLVEDSICKSYIKLSDVKLP